MNCITGSLFAKQATLFSSCFFLQMKTLFFNFSIFCMLPDTRFNLGRIEKDLLRLLNSRMSDEPTNQNTGRPFLHHVQRIFNIHTPIPLKHMQCG